jgi:hypothetical protein
MDSGTALLKVMFYLLLFFIFYLIMWFGRGFIGKFLDKISPLPYLRERGNYKFRNAQEELTSQGMILFLFLNFSVCYLLFLLVFGFDYFIILFPVFFPSLMLALRTRTFNDNNILSKSGIGYNHVQSYVLSFLGSFGFLMLVPAFFSGEFHLDFGIIVLILSLISSVVPIFPDYFNRFLPYDVRTEKGQNVFRIISISLIIILFTFMYSYLVLVLNIPISELLPPRLGGI